MMRAFLFATSLVSLVACTTTSPQSARLSAPVCDTPAVTLTADFPAAGMESCQVIDDRTIQVAIRPEDAEINPSPWYSVKLTPKSAGLVTLKMDYGRFKHRYAPKTSTDGETWEPLNERLVSVAEDKLSADITVQLENAPVWLSGQEIIDSADYAAWEEGLTLTPGVALSTIGTSKQGRPIRMLSTDPAGAKRTVMLVGRQHPPELTGALAMRSFVETVLADTPLANEFREKYALAIVANMNPDGVDLGHWRHNTGHTDLNRDWGPFTQPETETIRNLLASDWFSARPPALFVDFHSTFRNVFYTQPPEDEPTPYDFTTNWLTQSSARVPDYEFERADRHNDGLPTAKNYMFATYSIPSITYELADETDRELIERSAAVFAEEMMRLLVQHQSD